MPAISPPIPLTPQPEHSRPSPPAARQLRHFARPRQLFCRRHQFGLPTVDPSGQFLYVANAGDNTISVYDIIQSAPSTGALTAMGTAGTNGVRPLSVAVDPSGRFAYAVNICGSDSSCNNFYGNVTAFTIASSSASTPGALTAIGTVDTGSDPYAVTVDPSGHFAYVVNHCGNDPNCTQPGNIYTYTITQSGSNAGALVQTASADAGNGAYAAAVSADGKSFTSPIRATIVFGLCNPGRRFTYAGARCNAVCRRQLHRRGNRGIRADDFSMRSIPIATIPTFPAAAPRVPFRPGALTETAAIDCDCRLAVCRRSSPN